MQNFLRQNDKYGLLAIPGLFHELPEDFSATFPPDVHVTTRLNLPEATHWKEWIGTIGWGEIEEAELFLIKRLPSQAPDMFDSKNTDLVKDLLCWWNLLKIVGSFRVRRPILLTGAYRNKGIDIRQRSVGEQWFCQGDDEYEDFRPSDCDRWFRIYEANAQNQADIMAGRGFLRIVRGFRNYFKALDEEMVDWRFPKLVRSIEAFLLPKSGATKKQFGTRCFHLSRLLTPTSPIPRETFLAIYDLRSQIDHLHDCGDGTEKEWALINTCEHFARALYQKFLLDQSFQKHFVDDPSINTYWASL
jgi:hypothetical protein